jgi:spore germination protein
MTRTHASITTKAFLGGALAFVISLSPMAASAATTDLEYSGWIPYWKAADGAKDAKKHLSQLDEINPFAYSVKTDGTLSDTMKLDKSHWKTLFKDARKKNVKIVPTVMWSDSANIHRVLGDPTLRANHIASIVDAVEENDFDGIDIDYENKLAETKDYYSIFLKELSVALDDTALHCTIESRTPLDSRYTNPPASVAYANDFVEINKYCDRVRIMMYDQSTIDQKLNKAEAGKPYMPLSDVRWVEKAARLAMVDIDPDKIVLAVPTYGYEYRVTKTGSTYSYERLWSLNPGYATDTAKKFKVKPAENSAGEMSFEYNANAKKKKAAADNRLVWWSGASAIADKVALAKELGLAGVAIFKIDGAEDKNIWKVLK